ncbi:CLUMA_CG010116, isoform A [Clunio marinus]|uniref:CLUMA_CG010116, isoform A n=1 Tax=Clunio marinus TaxID=568069 RepID=A0A1J1I998_9DIPT|nr:CLUMA_CG010116, isoform A [Clunio marinus]
MQSSNKGNKTCLAHVISIITRATLLISYDSHAMMEQRQIMIMRTKSNIKMKLSRFAVVSYGHVISSITSSDKHLFMLRENECLSYHARNV